jgi:murein DD-endopeptidase MepM/ murein hydrolase activator NlpD
MTLFNSRTLSILLASGALGACTTAGAPRPNYPIEPASPPPAYTPPPAASMPPPAREEPPAARPSPPVSSAPLPAPGRAQSAAPAYTPPPAPVTRQVTKLTVTGKVVDASGPPVVYEVKKGDNLDAIARTLKTTREQLAKDNKLKEPYRLHPGDELKGPQSKGKAYVVGQGDTLFAISRRFGVTPEAIAEANDMGVNTPIRANQRLLLPDGFKDKGPTRTVVTETVTPPPQPRPQPQPQRPAPTYTPPPSRPAPPPPPPPPAPYNPPPARPAPARPEPAKPEPAPSKPVTPIVPSSGPVPDSQISELGRGRFVWPVQGDILSDFGPKGTGSRNDGINIKAPAGETVRAAAAGDIVYAGDQVPGFGNLVLIKHADGWVTAYGHLGRVDVKMTQKVVQGQQIGQAGATGGVSEPQVHFEVRYAPSPTDRARPIDPKLVLPK